ncbi:MAG: DNA polymerase III subunit delta' [Pontibacterium sp.]
MAEAAVYPWLDTCWQHLCELHRNRRLPHALMLYGVRGVGKADFARAFAHYLLCQSPDGNQPCGQCRACQLNAVNGHPDLFQLTPEGPDKPIKVDQVRGLTDFICSTAQQGGYRVVILNPADALNLSAANALLKMLEEPGQDTVLLLLTDRPGQVMPTIKSRCQRVECPLPQESEAVAFVVDRLDTSAEDATAILRINNGAPLLALDYQANGLETWRTQLITGLADVLKQRRTAVEVAQSWQKADLELLLGWIYSLVVDISRVKLTQTEDIQQLDARNMLLAVARRGNLQALLKFANLVQDERKSLILRQNPNKQMLLERILLEWVAITR